MCSPLLIVASIAAACDAPWVLMRRAAVLVCVTIRETVRPSPSHASMIGAAERGRKDLGARACGLGRSGGGFKKSTIDGEKLRPRAMQDAGPQ
jgi:hypothetical protein